MGLQSGVSSPAGALGVMLASLAGGGGLAGRGWASRASLTSWVSLEPALDGTAGGGIFPGSWGAQKATTFLLRAMLGTQIQQIQS